MKNKNINKTDEFRIKLETKDGVLIQNRISDALWLWNDKIFAEYSLRIDCREKGVRLISFSQDVCGIYGLVEYLK